jgi:hypothetical protein
MKRIIISIVIALCCAAAAAGQGLVRIASIEYEVRGRTNPYFLSQKAELSVGDEFPSREAFEERLKRVRQRLLNERVLEEVEVMSTYAAGEGVVTLAGVTIKVRDTWNIIALPYFKYDSNDGLLLSVRARDYNFLGTMLPLRINFNYEYDTSSQATFGADLGFSYPFPAVGLDWALGFSGSLAYHDGGANPDLGLGLSLGSGIALGPGRLDFSLSQNLNLNGRASDGSDFDDPLYLTSSADIGWSVPLWTSAQGDKLSLRPRAGVSGKWLPGGLSDPELKGDPVLSTGAGLSFGRVDWIGNFRDGYAYSVDAGASFATGSDALSRTISGSAELHRNFGWFGISARFKTFYSADGPSQAPGEAMRGILNSRAASDLAYTVNLDLPVRVIRFVPSEWFGVSWMRYFNFEQHWSPFLDFSNGHYDDTWFLVSKGWYAAGLEVITFPLAMRSFYLRISAGWSLTDFAALRALSGASPRDGKGIRELFIGLGHHY